MRDPTNKRSRESPHSLRRHERHGTYLQRERRNLSNGLHTHGLGFKLPDPSYWLAGDFNYNVADQYADRLNTGNLDEATATAIGNLDISEATAGCFNIPGCRSRISRRLMTFVMRNSMMVRIDGFFGGWSLGFVVGRFDETQRTYVS